MNEYHDVPDAGPDAASVSVAASQPVDNGRESQRKRLRQRWLLVVAFVLVAAVASGTTFALTTSDAPRSGLYCPTV
jgi:hypothetical protein